jgi:hypothetical protein
VVTAATGADTGKHFAGIAPPVGVPTAGQAMARAFACPFWVAYESLARKGETMTTAEIVAYAYDQIDQARTEPNAVSK